jgi:hypothetical protein
MFLTVRTGYRGAMGELPTPLRVLEEDRGLLIRCLDALEATPVAVERADLAKETALLAARYENVLADAFYPQIVELLGTRSSLDRVGPLLDQLRSAVVAVRTDLRGVAPIDAHLSDPDGLEEDIGANQSTAWHPGIDSVLDSPK